MAFLFVIKVCTSDSTLVLSVRCGDPSAPSLAALAPQLQIIGHTGGKGRFVADTREREGEAAVVEGADTLGRGFPLIQVCAEGDRGGQKTDILQLLPKGIVAIRGAAFSPLF